MHRAPRTLHRAYGREGETYSNEEGAEAGPPSKEHGVSLDIEEAVMKGAQMLDLEASLKNLAGRKGVADVAPLV